MPIQTRDTAIQNELVRLYCRFQRNGQLMNPAAQPLVEIISADGSTIIDTVSAQMEYTGIFYIEWFVPKNLPLGTYYDKWTFQWDETASVEELVMPIQVRSFDNYLNFVGRGLSQKLDNRVIQLLQDFENLLIYEATHIPIYRDVGMRIQQENQDKRTKVYYSFELDAEEGYEANEGDVYFNNGQKFTVFETLVASNFYSTSSSLSEVSSGSANSSESTSSVDSSSTSSSFSTSSNSSMSDSSLSSMNMSSESSSSETDYAPQVWPDESSQTEEPTLKVVLVCVGTGQPKASGSLSKVKGDGSASINYTGVTSKQSKFSTIYECTYRNWVPDWKPIVYLNQRIIDDGWYADYDGKIYFDRLMTPEDTVEVTYKFSCYSKEALLSFLRMGLMMMNAVPPSSRTYSDLATMPTEWTGPVILYASIQALRRAIFGMNFQQKRAIYGGAGNDDGWAQQALSSMQSLYQEFNTQWEAIKKDVKSSKLPSMAIISVPSHTLPGGRCMSADTYINCTINNEVFYKSIVDIYNLHSSGNTVSVASMLNGKLTYESASKIWESGFKETFVLKTKSKEIRLSAEHLVYLPLKEQYVPVKDITENDYLLVYNDDFEVEKLVQPPTYYGLEKVYDIEVPSTENFIGNGIVSHNSRWFRMMFKSS